MIMLLFSLPFFITSTALSDDVPSSMFEINNLMFHCVYSLRFMYCPKAGEVNMFYTCIAW